MCLSHGSDSLAPGILSSVSVTAIGSLPSAIIQLDSNVLELNTLSQTYYASLDHAVLPYYWKDRRFLTACLSGTRHATATQPTWTKRTMIKISTALRLFRYAALLNKEGNSNMAKISIETHTNGTLNAREWHSGRDVTFH